MNVKNNNVSIIKKAFNNLKNIIEFLYTFTIHIYTLLIENIYTKHL